MGGQARVRGRNHGGPVNLFLDKNCKWGGWSGDVTGFCWMAVVERGCKIRCVISLIGLQITWQRGKILEFTQGLLKLVEHGTVWGDVMSFLYLREMTRLPLEPGFAPYWLKLCTKCFRKGSNVISHVGGWSFVFISEFYSTSSLSLFADSIREWKWARYLLSLKSRFSSLLKTVDLSTISLTNRKFSNACISVAGWLWDICNWFSHFKDFKTFCRRENSKYFVHQLSEWSLVCSGIFEGLFTRLFVIFLLQPDQCTYQISWNFCFVTNLPTSFCEVQAIAFLKLFKTKAII